MAVPSAWEKAQAAIRRLDGETETIALVARRGPSYLRVGGGRDGRYVVHATFDNRTFHHLVDPAAGEGTIALRVGGDDWEYPVRRCVGLKAALQAAKHFAETRALDPSLTWEEVQRFGPSPAG